MIVLRFFSRTPLCLASPASAQALSRWMRESKTASHFVKYMVSNLSVNQSQLQDQVKQIGRAVATLAADIQGMHQRQDTDASALRKISLGMAQSSISPKLTAAKSSKSLDSTAVNTAKLQFATVDVPHDASQLPTLLQRLDECDSVGVQPIRPISDETIPSIGAILQMLQDSQLGHVEPNVLSFWYLCAFGVHTCAYVGPEAMFVA